MAEILELIMVLCFGLSWPISIIKTLKTNKNPNTYRLHKK